MKRFYCILVALCVSCIAAMAQNNQVKPFEFELGAGVTAGSKYNMDKVAPGPNFFLESRYNLPTSPWDFALQLSMGGAWRKQDDKLYSGSNKFGLTAFSDYNFRKWNNVAPFIGLGVGRTAIQTTSPATAIDGSSSTLKTEYPAFILNPRVGVELFDHVRLTAEYKYTFDVPSSYFALNLGIAFGGGKKR